VSDPGDSDLTFTDAAKQDFGEGFMRGFILVIMFAAVALRLYVGVRQRLARERNIIDVDPSR